MLNKHRTIIYQTEIFLSTKITLFKYNQSIVFISLSENAVAEFLARYPNERIAPGIVNELTYFQAYELGKPVAFSDIDVDYLKGTDFERNVWHALHTMRQTEVLTYGDLAIRAGYPKAIRAVASAVGRNPLTIINACHRIFPKNAGIGQYRYGSELKKKLIQLDGIELTNL